jgi:hypothetical protein
VSRAENSYNIALTCFSFLSPYLVDDLLIFAGSVCASFLAGPSGHGEGFIAGRGADHGSAGSRFCVVAPDPD